MVRAVSAKLDASGKRFALVVSRWNDFLTGKLAAGAIDCIVRHGGSDEQIAQIWVPGSFEIPLAAQKLAQSKQYDAVICLGCVIRGQTPHFDYIAAEVTKGIAQASLQTGVPIAFGIITADALEQAIDRAGAKHGNKGAEAALAAIEMVNLLPDIS
jgi:6,7-dimethyl-8-ribityllumazine synthase